ncbi:MAG: ribbon-helix-helix domain-containing protein [Bryobacteraceae bacterium]
MVRPHEVLVTQLDAEMLLALRVLAEQEGRSIQALVEEALTNLIEKHNGPRPDVLGAYMASHRQYERLYKKLSQ